LPHRKISASKTGKERGTMESGAILEMGNISLEHAIPGILSIHILEDKMKN
jgi:hypothetical protein